MIRKIVGLYYSPVGGTRQMTEMIARDIAGMVGDCSNEDVSFELHDLEDMTPGEIELGEESVVVVGIPAYMGKIPLPAAKSLAYVKGEGAMTLVAVSYGGKSYGNALYELQRCTEETGLKVIGAGAFRVRFKGTRGIRTSLGPVLDVETLDDFDKAAAAKIQRLYGCEVEGLKIKPAPVEAPGRMPVHMISKISPKAAQVAQRMCNRFIVIRHESEWFL